VARPVELRVTLDYGPGGIPGSTRLNVLVRAADDTPEVLELAFKHARRQIERGLREPMRPCGFPGPWAGHPAWVVGVPVEIEV
jgi:hypothetical protein